MSPTTIGLASSPVAAALAGLRAHEARYFKYQYDLVFTVEPAAKAKKTIEWVHRILKQERDIVIASPPLEATTVEVENIRWPYVFYESGLAINVAYALDDPKKRDRRCTAGSSARRCRPSHRICQGMAHGAGAACRTVRWPVL